MPIQIMNIQMKKVFPHKYSKHLVHHLSALWDGLKLKVPNISMFYLALLDI